MQQFNSRQETNSEGIFFFYLRPLLVLYSFIFTALFRPTQKRTFQCFIIPNVSKSNIASVHSQCLVMLKPYLSILFKKKDFSSMIPRPHLFLREQECLWISQHVSISLLDRFSSLSLFISSSKISVCPGATKGNENKHQMFKIRKQKQC